MLKKTFIFLIVIKCCFLNLKAQITEETLSLNILRVINENFYSILDNIIEHEEKCDYYSSELKFIISIHKYEIITEIQIETIEKQFRKLEQDPVNNIGIFEYKGFLFLVEGVLEETLFSLTSEKKDCIFLILKDEIDADTGEYHYTIIEDDSLSYWGFHYKDMEFIYQGMSTYCK